VFLLCAACRTCHPTSNTLWTQPTCPFPPSTHCSSNAECSSLNSSCSTCNISFNGQHCYLWQACRSASTQVRGLRSLGKMEACRMMRAAAMCRAAAMRASACWRIRPWVWRAAVRWKPLANKPVHSFMSGVQCQRCVTFACAAGGSDSVQHTERASVDHLPPASNPTGVSSAGAMNHPSGFATGPRSGGEGDGGGGGGGGGAPLQPPAAPIVTPAGCAQVRGTGCVVCVCHRQAFIVCHEHPYHVGCRIGNRLCCRCSTWQGAQSLTHIQEHTRLITCLTFTLLGHGFCKLNKVNF